MPLNSDISTALQLLEHIQSEIEKSGDPKLQSQTNEYLMFLISTLENPILRTIAYVQDAVSELNEQLQQHPSLLPGDFDISLAGDLVLGTPSSPAHFTSSNLVTPPELDDQCVPQTSPLSSTEQIATPESKDVTLTPITTASYILEFQKAIEESAQGREIITIQLMKPEGGSLGFSVVSLRSEDKGELGIFVQEIQPKGIAGRDGRLHEGDQILAIDGQPLDTNISHQQAFSILQKARGRVELVVARTESPSPPPLNSPSPSRSPSPSNKSETGSDMVLNTEWAQVEVIDLINDGSGLGFGIIGGRSTGVVVKTILRGGVAERDGRLQSGDHILQIGGVSLRGMGREQVAAVLRQAGSHVRLIVARPVDAAATDLHPLGSHAPIVPTKLLADAEELDKHLIQNGYSTTSNILEPYNIFSSPLESDLDLNETGLIVDVAPSLPVLTMDMIPPESLQPLPDTEKFTVVLKKDVHGLGITIAGYVCEKEELSGIFVKSISEGSAADLCKKIQVNDRIVEVDGKSLQGYTNHQAVEVLRSTGQTVKLCLERYLRGPKFEQLQQAIANSQLKAPTPPSPSALSLPRVPIMNDGETCEIDHEGESQDTVDSIALFEANNADVDLESIEMLIDDDYSGPLKPTVEAAIQAKWSKILGPDVDIVVGQLCKFGEGGGLGISLEGTVDVEDGQEVRPHHYIRSILPEGPVGRNGRLKSGDELLEVNGERLLGMNHVEVVSILKELPINVRMVCARRKGENRLIDTSQDRAAFAARSLLGGSLQNLIPAMDRLVKAKSDGSLASSATVTTDPSLSKLKSRSLEPLTGLAMWSSEPHIIELMKGERGLGFSILDYQDPMNPSESVIVIRSLVPGGVAQLDGRLIPGDRLLSVNSTNLENASLDQAVQALKGAPKGVVKIGVAKPLPIPDSVSQSQGDDDATPTLDDHSMYSCEGSLPSDLEEQIKNQFVENEIEYHKDTLESPKEESIEEGKFKGRSIDEPVKEDVDVCEEKLPESESPDRISGSVSPEVVPEVPPEVVPEVVPKVVPGMIPEVIPEVVPENESVDFEEEPPGLGYLTLPTLLEEEIQMERHCPSFGVTLEFVGDGSNGMLVKNISSDGDFARDNRIVPNDFLVSLNNENLRHITNAQARLIIQRAELLLTPIYLRFISHRKARLYLRSVQNEKVETKVLAKVSPRIFPEYYRSPYIRQEDFSIPDQPASFQDSIVTVICAEKLAHVDHGIEAPSNLKEADLPCVDIQTDSSPVTCVERRVSPDVTDSCDKLETLINETESILNETHVPFLSDETINKDTASNLDLTLVPFVSDENEAVGCDDVDFSSETVSNLEAEEQVRSDSCSVRERAPSILSLIEEPSNVDDSTVKCSIQDEVLTSDLKSSAEVEDETIHGEISSRLSSIGDDLNFSGDESSETLSLAKGPQSEPKAKTNLLLKHLNNSVPRLGSVDLESSGFLSNSSSRGSRISKLHRFASTGVELEEEEIMTVSPQSSSVLLAKNWGPEKTVKVVREPNSSLGISIVGGKVDLFNARNDGSAAISGIFIKNVLPNSPAGRTGELKTGDRILEVDGVDLRHASHERAVEVIRASSRTVTFLVQSLVQWSGENDERHSRSSQNTGTTRRKAPQPPTPTEPQAPFASTTNNFRSPSSEQLQDGSNKTSKVEAPKPAEKPAAAAPKPKPPPVKKQYSSDSEDSEEDTRDQEGRLITKGGQEIMRSSAGNVKRTKEEIEADPEQEDEFGYTLNKVKKKYAAHGDAVCIVSVERGHQGLGISLAGHKDRTKMAAFICGLNPNGPAFKSGVVKVGDEILEVNGVVLRGRCHLNASAIIKGLAGPTYKIILLRRSDALEELAVKPITQFPVSLDDETPEEKFAHFKGLKIVTIKKPGYVEAPPAPPSPQVAGQGLGIMIIEGKHAEVGQGIFISDIQEGSAAEQAGLIVGDMILAVNKDTILGNNYDSAASLLKKTEGVVTLVVCNPQKAKEDEKKAGGDKPKEPEKPKEPPADPATAPIKPGAESVIEINKDKMGLGLSIVGGSDTLLGAIIIHEVYPDGAAAKDGRLLPGDVILECNSEDFRNITHSKALAALRQTPAKVKMTVLRDDVAKEEDKLEIIDVELNKKPGKGLGLSIVGRKNGPGIFISEVVSGGAANVDGRLMKGDQILSVNGRDLKTASQEEAAAVLKTTSGKVQIKLGRRKAKLSAATSDNENEDSTGEETEGTLRTVTLERGPDGLGFSIVGGACSPHGNLPIYVKTVFFDLNGLLKRGDQIVAVDGLSLEGLTHQQAVDILKKAQGVVTLTIQS
ncbi:multiple PDZ domain protein isoform X4 [Bemisia tabaci]|uniref:multiple PDZ domain protein isoform X4 n=1 Tax=Bemisia tabaci TaxID=7038 RepID=UPI003B282137